MEEGDTKKNWPLEKSKQPEQTSRISRVVSKNNTTLDKYPSSNNDHSLLPVTNSDSSPLNQAKNQHSVVDNQSNTTTTLPEKVNNKKFQKLPSWAKSWALWAILLAFAPGSIAFVAISILLKLPSAPNCPSIFWPLASASVRLHCSQLAASKQNVKDLLQAIYLVQHLPKNHPLRSEINRLIEQWSRDILMLADLSFQDGKLEQAITTARKIPQDLFIYKLVEEKIGEWQSIWSKAEELYQKAESELRGQQWQSVFMTAANLSQLNNKYWANIKYNQLNQLIAQAREDGTQLAQAKSLAKSKSVNDLLKAIELAESISEDSSIYASAQKLIPDISQIMLDIAQSKLEQQNVDEAISIAQDVPDGKVLREKKEDFIALAEAQRNAWLGTMSNLKVAISQAQQINSSRPNYEKAQQLISRWELEIEDVSHLERARVLASQGTVGGISAAIAQAQLISINNPRSLEARKEIRRWIAQIQIIEDRPYLEQAEQIALLGDVNSLQAAITEASHIRPGRALYGDAQKKIARWATSVEVIQDRPILHRARLLAGSGNLGDAITIASQIYRDRALYQEARREIHKWREEINAKQNWRMAKDISLWRTPQALVRAIRLASRIPSNHPLGIDPHIAIEQWSQQLLDIARSQGQSDITRGIKTARLVPQGTTAYNLAREQIKIWQQFLKPIPEKIEGVIASTEEVIEEDIDGTRAQKSAVSTTDEQ